MLALSSTRLLLMPISYSFFAHLTTITGATVVCTLLQALQLQQLPSYTLVDFPSKD